MKNWSYPPTVLLLVLVLGIFSYPVALILWTLVTYAAYAFAVAYKRPSPWALSAVLFFAPSSFENVTYGQHGFLMGALLVGGLRLLECKPVLAGVLLGFLSIKPQLALLVPVALIAARKWRTLGAAAVTALLLALASVLAFGAEAWVGFFTVTARIPYAVLTSPLSMPWTWMFPTPFMGLRLLGFSLDVAVFGAALVALLVGGLVFYVFEKTRAEEARANILLTGVLLATPYGLTYDMTIVSAAIVSYTAIRSNVLSHAEIAVLLVLWGMPVAVYGLSGLGLPFAPAAIAAFLVMQVLVFFRNEPWCEKLFVRFKARAAAKRSIG